MKHKEEFKCPKCQSLMKQINPAQLPFFSFVDGVTSTSSPVMTNVFLLTTNTSDPSNLNDILLKPETFGESLEGEEEIVTFECTNPTCGQTKQFPVWKKK